MWHPALLTCFVPFFPDIYQLDIRGSLGEFGISELGNHSSQGVQCPFEPMMLQIKLPAFRMELTRCESNTHVVWSCFSDARTFSLIANCSRGVSVLLIWRAEGKDLPSVQSACLIALGTHNSASAMLPAAASSHPMLCSYRIPPDLSLTHTLDDAGISSDYHCSVRCEVCGGKGIKMKFWHVSKL
jgi:hypothetical protein